MAENEKNKVNKSIIDNKLAKYGVTKKTAYSVSSVVICIFLIIVMSITQATFDSSLLKTVNFWIDFVILSGLSIYGMIAGQQAGDDVSRNNPNGAFRNSLKRFSIAFEKLDNLKLFAYFEDWLEIYREKKLRRKIEGMLKDHGIHQMEVLDLDISELHNLEKPFKKEWLGKEKEPTYFLTYTKEQIEVIEYCLAGKVKVSKLPRTFFVDAFYHSEKDMWESAAKSSKKKGRFLSVNYAYKIIALLAISILSAGLVPGGFNDSAKQAAMWLTLAKRIFCVMSAFIWGMFVGFELVKIDISYLDYKTDVLNLYYQEHELKIFVPKSVEERAKLDYDNMTKVEVDTNGERIIDTSTNKERETNDNT